MNKSKFVVRDIVEIAMLVAIAVVLDLDGLKFTVFPSGGSIGLTMVPLFIIAFRHGVVKGFFGIGIVYALITCMLDGHSWAYFPFDYVLAYGSICLAGFFFFFFFKDEMKTKKDYALSITFYIIAIIMGCITRLIGSTLSSLIIYPLVEGGEPLSLWAAITYNFTYIGPSALFVIIVMIVLYYPLLRIQKQFPTKNFQEMIPNKANNPVEK